MEEVNATFAKFLSGFTRAWSCNLRVCRRSGTVVSMNFSPYQTCRTNEGWQPVEIDSASEADKIYVVLVNPWGDPREHICDCEGYRFRGYCRHQAKADEEVCRWTEVRGFVEIQTSIQARELICPKCGGPTKVELSVV